MNWRSIKICGRRQGNSSVDWQQEIPLTNPDPKSFSSSLADYLKKIRQFRPTRRMIIIGASTIGVIFASYVGYSGFTLLQMRFAQAETIKKAQSLVVEANADQAQGSEPLRVASVKLKQARNLLRNIADTPGSLYSDAQNELKKVHSQIEQIEQKSDAEKTAVSNFKSATEGAKQAVESVRNRPKPLQTWQQAKEALEKAISQLKAIPSGTSPFTEAQKQLGQYQKQLQDIDQGIAAENRAMQVLAQAENFARQAMSDTPSSLYHFELQDLQASQSSWKRAITQVKKVPPGSYANLAAQEQLLVYAHNTKQIADGIREIQECNARAASSSFLDIDLCDTPFISLRDPEFIATTRPDEN